MALSSFYTRGHKVTVLEPGPTKINGMLGNRVAVVNRDTIKDAAFI